MTSRERTLAALRHEEPDKVPICLAYETPEELAACYGRKPGEIAMRQDIYAVSLQEPPPAPGVAEQYLCGVPPRATVNAWGVAMWRPPGVQSYSQLGPLRNMTTVAELEEYPFPDVGSDACAESLAEQVARLHAGGFAVQGAMSQTIFELAWSLCGMENLMMAFHIHPEFAHYLLDRITERAAAMARQHVRAGVDILRLGDDVGWQRGMMISLSVWRAFLKPRLSLVIAAAREEKCDIPIFYHSDGDIRTIIEDLIQVGVTILNPIQPECMDPSEIKRRYGDRLTLWGTIGTQSLLPFGTPEDVEGTVREYMEVLAPGGGYVIGPTHSINSDVPWENIAAFYAAAEQYGAY